VSGRRDIEAERASRAAADLTAVWGPAAPTTRAPRILGLFAHPDDEVFCVGGTIARCAEAGAVTGIVSLTHGEAGQIRDAAAATRRTLGAVRAKELEQSARALGVDDVSCLDMGDGVLEALPLRDVVDTVSTVIDDFRPDVVVTFGPDGGFGHPDHVASCRATIEAMRAMANPPRLLHATFPMSGQLLLDSIVEWLTSHPQRFIGTAAFGHALKLFADGTSMLGFAADHMKVEWYPAGSFIIEQGEPARELFCILSGSADIVVESDDGRMQKRDMTGAGCFVGEDGLASGRPRNAHVIARDDVTCLVLAPDQPKWTPVRRAGTGDQLAAAWTAARATARGHVDDCITVDVKATLEQKVAALAAHRSQYALEAGLLPRSVLHRLLGREHFVVADIAAP
jgi:LmbE family N-acetylglucosaminyl deacetylase